MKLSTFKILKNANLSRIDEALDDLGEKFPLVFEKQDGMLRDTYSLKVVCEDSLLVHLMTVLDQFTDVSLSHVTTL